LISHLQAEDGTSYTNHKDKEILLWEAIKEMLGSSEFSGFYFDSEILIESFTDKANFLEVLQQDYTES